MSDLTLVWLPKHGSQLPKGITSFLSALSQWCRWGLGVAISSDLPLSCSLLRQDLSLTLDSTSQWASQQCCLDFHCTVMSFFYKDRRDLNFVFLKMGGKVTLFSFFLLLRYTADLWMFLWRKHCKNGAELSELTQAPRVYHKSPSSCRLFWSLPAPVKWGEHDLCDRAPMSVHEAEVPQMHGMIVLLHSQLQPWPPMGLGISFFFRTFSSCTCLLT